MAAERLAAVATVMNNPLKDINKGIAAFVPDAFDKYYGDILIEAKALKIKIAEHVKKTPEIEKIDEYSIFN